MGDRQRFDRAVVFKLITEEKKSVTEVAKQFGVTKAAISRAMKELRPAIANQVSLEAGARVVTSHLNTLDQLRKINSDANEILELMMRWQRGDPGALQVLESQVRTVKTGSADKPQEVQMFKIKDPREIALKAMSEIREQLALQNDLMKTMYDVNAIAEFQKYVLETIGQANTCSACGEELVCAKCGAKINLRAEILIKLKEARALRSGVSFRP